MKHNTYHTRPNILSKRGNLSFSQLKFSPKTSSLIKYYSSQLPKSKVNSSIMSAYTRGNGRYIESQARGGRDALRSGYRNKTIKQDEPEWPSGNLIKAVNLSDLSKAETSPRIERCEYLASYNWLDQSKHPTILIPGMNLL